jgi:hypothetical protein
VFSDLDRRMQITPSAIVGSSAIGVAVFVLAASPAAATMNASPISKTPCPSAAVVNVALGQKNKAPVATTTPYAKICTYKGTGIVPTRITFQEDTAATFAAGEKAAAAVGPVVKVPNLGKSAWAPKSGGGLYVFLGTESLRMVSPLTPTTKLETLARKII